VRSAAVAAGSRVAAANMVRGIRVVSVERGHDWRRQTLVPFGGAGRMDLAARPRSGHPLHDRHMVSDLRHELMQTRLAPHASFAPAEV